MTDSEHFVMQLLRDADSAFRAFPNCYGPDMNRFSDAISQCVGTVLIHVARREIPDLLRAQQQASGNEPHEVKR